VISIEVFERDLPFKEYKSSVDVSREKKNNRKKQRKQRNKENKERKEIKEWQ